MNIDFDLFKDLYESGFVTDGEYRNKSNLEFAYNKALEQYLEDMFSAKVYIYHNPRKDEHTLKIISNNKEMDLHNASISDIENFMKSNITDSKEDREIKEVFSKLKNKDVSLGEKPYCFYAYGEFFYTYNDVLDLMCYAYGGLASVKSHTNNNKMNELLYISRENSVEDKNSKDTPFVDATAYSSEIRVGSFIDLGYADDEFYGVYVKFYKNGKVEFKGLDSSAWDKIANVISLLEE